MGRWQFLLARPSESFTWLWSRGNTILTWFQSTFVSKEWSLQHGRCGRNGRSMTRRKRNFHSSCLMTFDACFVSETFRSTTQHRSNALLTIHLAPRWSLWCESIQRFTSLAYQMWPSLAVSFMARSSDFSGASFLHCLLMVCWGCQGIRRGEESLAVLSEIFWRFLS